MTEDYEPNADEEECEVDALSKNEDGHRMDVASGQTGQRAATGPSLGVESDMSPLTRTYQYVWGRPGSRPDPATSKKRKATHFD